MKTTKPLSKSLQALHDSLLTAVDALSRRRACDVPEQVIDRLVAMRWLQWSAGSLRLTAVGEAKVVEVQAGLLMHEPLAA